jgi:hypothetical protein
MHLRSGGAEDPAQPRLLICSEQLPKKDNRSRVLVRQASRLSREGLQACSNL